MGREGGRGGEEVDYEVGEEKGYGEYKVGSQWEFCGSVGTPPGPGCVMYSF